MPRSARKSLTSQSSAHSAGMILAKMCQNSGQQNNNNININTNTNTINKNSNNINSNNSNKSSIITITNTNCGSSPQISTQSMANSSQSSLSTLSGTPSILHSKKHCSTSLSSMSSATPQSQSLMNVMDDNNSSSNLSAIISSSPSSVSRSTAFASLIGAATNQFNQFNIDSLQSVPIKRRKQDPKTGKGLRHFSMKVCEKVKLKGSTTYNEVADELVAEFSTDPIASRAAFQGGYLPGDAEPFDQKNIRRRVYDALNVLMAMNIISKEKKEIKWIGLPTNAAQECVELELEREKRMERINVKKQQLRDLLLQQIAFKNLVERNRSLGTVPASNALINLPFIIVNTEKKTVIDCSISNDKTEYLFNFDNTFEIHDDIEVLKRMGLAFHLEKLDGMSIDRAQVDKAKSILPEALRPELEEMMEERDIKVTPVTSPRKARHH